MNVITASAPAARLRMSTWRAFWSLLGGGVVGSIIAAVLESALSSALRLDDPGGRSSTLWHPFLAIGDWARAADLATLGVVLVGYALCVRWISRDDALELPLPIAVSGITAVAFLAWLTHSWWALLAILPVAFVVRYGARPPGRWAWRRRAVVVALAGLVYLAIVGAAVADQQLHPLTASPNMICGGGGGPGILQPLNPRPGPANPLEYPDRTGGTAPVCLAVLNTAWSHTATILGVATAALPRPAPWTIRVSAVSIGAGRQKEVPVAVRMTGCAGFRGRSAVLRSIPLRARVAGAVTTVQIALDQPIATTCPAG